MFVTITMLQLALQPSDVHTVLSHTPHVAAAQVSMKSSEVNSDFADMTSARVLLGSCSVRCSIRFCSHTSIISVFSVQSLTIYVLHTTQRMSWAAAAMRIGPSILPACPELLDPEICQCGNSQMACDTKAVPLLLPPAKRLPKNNFSAIMQMLREGAPLV
jgi:hypothetical protein